MKILVNDTNIFIDLHSVGLLEEMCRLPYEIHTVDLVVAEIADADQRRIFDELVARGEISVDGFTADEVIEMLRNTRQFPAISPYPIARYAISQESITYQC